ncbi:MAG TPA: hypothetical protein EYQ20_10280 [candidate division Zixibacteria bacterium]|nr:hypothetical protein [candidate division Zixibacteria bacterium]
MTSKRLLYIVPILILIPALIFFMWPEDMSDTIAFPYISHQKPLMDPHLPSSDDLSDKLDELMFDGLFNQVATPSGIAYESGLGTFVGMDANNVVTIKLNSTQKWHSSYKITVDDEIVNVVDADQAVTFVAQDINFTLRRIERLRSLSRDYILIAQALQNFDFEGPNAGDEIQFKFKGDRIWLEDEIKEVLSFKILPNTAELTAVSYSVGTGPYMPVPPIEEKKDTIQFYKNPSGTAHFNNVILQPFIDNSTFTTELNNARFNVLLGTPFGSISPILGDEERFFKKSNASTTFFAILLNTQRLSRDQRKAVRQFIDPKALMNRLYKVGTEQQRHIVDYKDNEDNYSDHLNYSVFPSSSYYVEEQIVSPRRDTAEPDLSALPDTLRIVAVANYGYREEYYELVDALNDEKLFFNKIKATVIQNEDIAQGHYDGILIAFTGYKSNFLFDLYDIFLRTPDLATYRINLKLTRNKKNEEVLDPTSITAASNFSRLDATAGSPEQKDVLKYLEYLHGFMATREIGDKQAYAGFIDELEHEMALGVWLFSLPTLAYFNTQFDQNTIHLYGVASQLSTIEKWKERIEE